jgi:hypothetical protein
MPHAQRMKHCPACGQVLPAEEFYRNRRHSDGLQTYCKACHLARVKASKEKLPIAVQRARHAAIVRRWRARRAAVTLHSEQGESR